MLKSKVRGLPDRFNDLILSDRISRVTKLIVFFGGDVQDLEDVMRNHRDNHRYIKWSLESVTKLLHEWVPSSQVVTVRPSRMERGTFSCYDNFVPTDSVGSPKHAENCGAIAHLAALLKESCPEGDFGPVTLVGFSKGVVVLNQILRELSFSNGLLIDRMVWLDGGHNGGKDIWPINKDLLSQLVLKNIVVDVRVTPYQVRNPNRPWIKREEKIFSESLKKLGANISRNLYFEDEEPSIENHFRIIETLKTNNF